MVWILIVVAFIIWEVFCLAKYDTGRAIHGFALAWWIRSLLEIVSRLT